MKVETVLDNNELRLVRLELSSYATNAYVIVCPGTQDSALVDVPPGAPTIIKHLKGTNLKYILLTHNHIDHIGGLKALRPKINATFCVHALDNQAWLPFQPDQVLSDGEVITVGSVKIKVLFTPGHTPGSLCYQIGDILISGDTIFPGGPGRTLGPSEFRQIVNSITEKIFPLSDKTLIFPGHGDSTILKKERDEYRVFANRKHHADISGDVVWLTT